MYFGNSKDSEINNFQAKEFSVGFLPSINILTNMKESGNLARLKSTVLFCLVLSTGIMSCSSDFKRTEILWDNYGVPHIYARNAQEMYYSFGWAQMSCHADLILKLYAEARGTAAELFGKEYLESDLKMRAFDLPGLARKGYIQQDQEFRSYIDAFTKGMNDYAAENIEMIDENLRKVLPVTVEDIMAHTVRVIHLEFLAGPDLERVKAYEAPGSNSIAVSASRSAGGNTMLVSNPHLPWRGFYTWYEAHLMTEGFNLYGVALVGMPTLSIAFNPHLGWTHTVNTIDASDRYELALKDNGYVLDGEVVPFDMRNVTIKVKHDDGSVTENTHNIRLSRHGPVVGEKGNKAWAVRVAGLENFKILEQYHRMGRATNLSEFESALRMLQNPMFNVVYADKDGNILYLFGGNVPKRSTGDFSFWSGTIDGTRSELIWKEAHGYEDLPRVLNPPSGFLQNCNDPPWTCTYPQVLDPSDFPAYMSPLGIGWRAQRAVNMMKGDDPVSFEQLVGYKLNTEMEVADRFLDDLLAAAEKFPDSTVSRATEVLRRWDRKTDNESRGAVLFAEWWNRINRSMFRVQWDPDSPASTPDGFLDEKQTVSLLKEASLAVESAYGSIDVQWGEVNRFRMNGADYPANGGPDNLGVFRCLYFAPDRDNRKRQVAGDTYIAVTEFGKRVKAKVLLSYGNASQKGNSHIGDQLQLMSEKKLRDALLERTEILENLEKKELINPDISVTKK